jgi:MFS superfamily sulfate permease-like transporter
VAIVILIPFANILKDVPLATLAAILLFVAARLFNWHDLRAIAHYDLIELALALITLLTVALVGVEQGIAVAVLLAILDRIRKSAMSHLAVLGRVAGTTSWTPLEADPDAAQQVGVLAVLFATPLWYANATHFREQMHAAFTKEPGTTRVVVLDSIGMSDLDFTGARAFGRMLDAAERQGVAFGMARAGERLRESMRRGGLLARIGEDHFFSTVDEAVTTLLAGPEAPPH